MAKVDKVSVGAVDNVIKETYAPTVTEEWNGINVTITKTLSLYDMIAFVDNVVKSCFRQETNEYMPEIKDFAIKSNILERYANFRMPSNIEHQYDMIYHTDVIDFVLKHVNIQQFREIQIAIDKKIDVLAEMNVQMVYKKIDDMVNAFEELQHKMEDTLGGVTKDDMAKVMSAISDGGAFDQEKLVEAYIAHTKGE